MKTYQWQYFIRALFTHRPALCTDTGQNKSERVALKRSMYHLPNLFFSILHLPTSIAFRLHKVGMITLSYFAGSMPAYQTPVVFRGIC